METREQRKLRGLSKDAGRSRKGRDVEKPPEEECLF
jgi:hypothetical protein